MNQHCIGPDQPWWWVVAGLGWLARVNLIWFELLNRQPPPPDNERHGRRRGVDDPFVFAFARFLDILSLHPTHHFFHFYFDTHIKGDILNPQCTPCTPPTTMSAPGRDLFGRPLPSSSSQNSDGRARAMALDPDADAKMEAFRRVGSFL